MLACEPSRLSDFVFLDMEIYRTGVRSVGNHLLQWDQKTPLPNLTHVVNPNLLRGITAQQFDRKYPFATLHFLLVLLSHTNVTVNIKLTPTLTAILLYPDGTHQVLFNYRRNVVDWLRFLQEHTGWEAPLLPPPSWGVSFVTHSAPLKASAYRQMLEQNPLSFALTSRSREQGLQYTLVPSYLLPLTD